MNPLSQYHPRSVYLGTSLGNILIVLIAFFVIVVNSANNRMRVPRPEFLPAQENVTVREGGVAVLPCTVRNLGTKQVVWRGTKDDQFLTIGKLTWVDDNHISLEYSKMQGQVSNWNLVIKHVTPDDEGIYECQITSRKGHTRYVHLRVVVISITGRRFVDLGDKIELKCNASGGARVADEMDWFKAGDKIDSNKYSHVLIEKYKSMETSSFISILIIEHSRLKDTGDYICRSSRNDIASLKVTVLHAETEQKRRGTENGRSQGTYQMKEGGKASSNTSSPSPNVIVILFCLYMVAILWNPHRRELS